MTQLLRNAQYLYPQALPGSVVRGRYYTQTGDKYRQWFSSGGHFRDLTGNMQFGSLAKVSALTIDVDAYELDEACAAVWGATRDERKAAMRAATEAQVLDWMVEVEFVDWACAEAEAVGLPAMPNRVVYTGQGVCLIYWLAADEGGVADAWTPLRIKEAVKRFVDVEGERLWWWDKCAKDVGTRLVPVPGTRHRATGKNIALLREHDKITPLTPWFEGLEAKYPPAAAKKAKATKAAKAQATGKRTAGTGNWKVIWFDPKLHTELEVGERDVCPLCQGSGYKRMDDDHYSCFSCETQFKIGVPLPFSASSFGTQPQSAPGYVALDANGYALWPASTPTRLLNKARTGSGKTHLMQRERAAWAPPSSWDHRVVAIAPTIALARGLAARLGLDHADAQSELTLAKGSLACCFASVAAKLGTASHRDLKATYIMVDEAESCLSQTAEMLRGERAREVYNVLVHVAAHAGKVMLADANAGPVCAQFMADVDAYAAHSGLTPPAWDVWHSDPHRHNFAYVRAVTKLNSAGKLVTTASSDSRHKGLILSRLDEGKRLAIYIPGRDSALGFAAVLRQRYPDRDIKCIVRNNSNDQQHDFSEAGLTADVLIYNNAMATGVSYDRANHYDEVHLLIHRGAVTDGIHIEQAVHRIRKPVSSTFYISGSLGNAVTDWRCSVEAQLQRAVKRLEAGQRAVQKIDGSLNLATDFMVSNEAKRLGILQAVILAGRYTRGWRWVMPWLAQHHSWTAVDGAECGDFGQEVSAARATLVLAEAAAIAQAAPLSEVDVQRVEVCGAEDEAEYHGFRAAKLQSIYGDAFTKADPAAKMMVAYETKAKRLAQRTRTFAGARMLLSGGADAAAVAAAEVRANQEQTVMTAQVTLPTAKVFARALVGLGACTPVDGRYAIDPLLALGICRGAAPLMRAAGLTPRDDLEENPFKQLNTLLALGGVPLRSVRPGGQDKRQRVYFVTEPDLLRMMNLSGAFVARWRDAMQAPKSSFAA